MSVLGGKLSVLWDELLFSGINYQSWMMNYCSGGYIISPGG